VGLLEVVRDGLPEGWSHPSIMTAARGRGKPRGGL
jgi:hypothetical protein